MRKLTTNNEWPLGLVKRGRKYYFHKMLNGEYIRHSLNTSNEKDAIKEVERINYDVSRGVDITKEFLEKRDQAIKQKNSFLELAKLFIKEKENDGLKKGSIKRYKGGVNNFLDFIEKMKLSPAVVDITPEIAFKYKIYRQDSLISKNGHVNAKKYTGVKKKTLKDDITLIKAVFQLGIKLKWIKENPFNDVKPGKQGKKDFRSLSKDEIALFLTSDN